VDEIATCVMCGKQIAMSELLDPNVLSDWRIIHWGGETVYVCSDEFPPDDAGQDAFRDAYVAVLQKMVDVSGKQPEIDEQGIL